MSHDAIPTPMSNTQRKKMARAGEQIIKVLLRLGLPPTLRKPLPRAVSEAIAAETSAIKHA